MRLDRAITLYAAAPIRRLLPGAHRARVRILMYHRISDQSEPGTGPYYRLNTSPKRFAEQMDFLAGEGYRVTDLSSALAFLNCGAEDQRKVVITFDDGFADFAEVAAPILARHQFTATVFLPTAFIGDTTRSFKNSPCLTWTQVKDLRSAGFYFGSHTVNHPKLHSLSWPEIDRELADSRTTLEDKLQEPITTFAHPYAFPETDLEYARGFSQALERNGYESCLTTRIGLTAWGDNRWILRRLPVNDCDDLALFKAKLEGGYDWLAFPQRLLKQAKRARCKTIGSPVSPAAFPTPVRN